MELAIRWPDIATILCYLLAMVAVGIHFSRRNKTTEEYFVGNRAMPGWVIGLSMLGTIISSSTFLALPAAAYILDWRQLSVNLVLPFVAVVAIVVFIPFFRSGRLTSAFEYLGRRYGAAPRLYGTCSFIAMQLIRMAQILFLVSLPIQFLTGLPVELVIIGAGVFIAFYTIAGGIEGVIWTDVVQAIILFFGGILCFVMIAIDLPGGVGQIIEIGRAHDKFSLGSFEWDLAQRTFWTVIVLGLVNWLMIYGGDQNMVQRYAAARSTLEARRATALYSAIALPMWILFFFVGSSLFVYYYTFQNPYVSQLETDQVLPYFILTEIPAGVAGIVISAVLAAAMSSLDSGINAVSTVTVIDLVKPYLAKGRSDKYYLMTARLIGLGVSILVIFGAVVFSRIEKESMNDVSLIVTSIFGGCVMGLFMLGFFTRSVDGTSATIAMALAILFNVYLGLGLLGWLPEAVTLNLHSYWVGAAVNACFIALALILSRLRRKEPGKLQGLTVWTMAGKRGKGKNYNHSDKL